MPKLKLHHSTPIEIKWNQNKEPSISSNNFPQAISFINYFIDGLGKLSKWHSVCESKHFEHNFNCNTVIISIKDTKTIKNNIFYICVKFCSTQFLNTYFEFNATGTTNFSLWTSPGHWLECPIPCPTCFTKIFGTSGFELEQPIATWQIFLVAQLSQAVFMANGRSIWLKNKNMCSYMFWCWSIVEWSKMSSFLPAKCQKTELREGGDDVSCTVALMPNLMHRSEGALRNIQQKRTWESVALFGQDDGQCYWNRLVFDFNCEDMAIRLY